MILVGSQDTLVDGPAVVGELRRHFRNAEAHVVEGGSHALFFDKKDEFVRLLLVFAGRLAVRFIIICYRRSFPSPPRSSEADPGFVFPQVMSLMR